MKTCDEMLNSLYERRAQYVTAQRKKKKVLAGIGTTLCAVSLLGGSVWYLNRPQHDIPVTIAPDKNEVTTTVDVPTEGEDTTTTTTTVNTTAPEPTTDGGIVTPPTTAPTTTASSKIEPPKTTAPSKTEPPKTTTSTTAPTDKLLITGDEPDDSLMQDASGAYMLDEISPLLKQTMEQYKDTDAVYAVLVAVNPGYNQKLVDDLHKAIDAFLESDEMVKLAEQRDLAREEWQAIDEERKANIGNEEWAAEFLADYVTKEETYRSLRSEYEKRREDFRWAYWNAYADEAIEALAEFSDINLVSLYERVTQDWEKMDKKEIDVIMRVLSVSWSKSLNDDYRHGYAAVLSADEILTLSESDSYIFWLASCDEDTTSYLIDW